MTCFVFVLPCSYTHGFPMFGIQFHPEVTHSTHGKAMLSNFVVDACKCPCTWTMASFVDEAIANIRATVRVWCTGHQRPLRVYRPSPVPSLSLSCLGRTPLSSSMLCLSIGLTLLHSALIRSHCDAPCACSFIFAHVLNVVDAAAVFCPVVCSGRRGGPRHRGRQWRCRLDSCGGAAEPRHRQALPRCPGRQRRSATGRGDLGACTPVVVALVMVMARL